MPKQFTHIDDEAIVWITKLNSREVGKPLEDEFFAWLTTSDSHQAAYIRAEALWQKGSVVAQLCPQTGICVQPSAEILDGQFNTAANRPRTPASLPRRRFTQWAVAAGTFAALAGGYFALPVPPPTQHWISAIGEQKEINLEDGSRVMLNTNSELTMTISRSDRRATLLRGEAYFDVHPDPKRPFKVLTSAGVVRVLGTHFSVRQLADDVQVTVAEGVVALGAESSEQSFKPWVQLKSNQLISFKQAQAKEPPRIINSHSELAWRSKQLVFKKQSLASAIDELMRYYDISIQLADPAVSAKEITAVIQLRDLTSTLDALCQALNLQADFTADKRSVRLIANAKNAQSK